MKQLFVPATLFLFSISAFSQKEEKNGTIYIKHPYIDIVNQSMKLYEQNDSVGNMKFFADTAHFLSSASEKWMKIQDAMKMWSSDFTFYDSIKVTTVGYPDYLHYVDKDSKIVQSWWKWWGKSKKTGEWLTIHFVQFDSFNKDGKIADESNYGDFSKMEH